MMKSMLRSPTSVIAGEDAPAAEQLDFQPLARGAELQQVVDETFHGERAVTGREPDRRIEPVAGTVGLVFRQHEVIHAADAEHRIADTGGDTRSQHGGDDLIACGSRNIRPAGSTLQRSFSGSQWRCMCANPGNVGAGSPGADLFRKAFMSGAPVNRLADRGVALGDLEHAFRVAQEQHVPGTL